MKLALATISRWQAWSALPYIQRWLDALANMDKTFRQHLEAFSQTTRQAV
jgi:hypothetical protein